VISTSQDGCPEYLTELETRQRMFSWIHCRSEMMNGQMDTDWILSVMVECVWLSRMQFSGRSKASLNAKVSGRGTNEMP
jgi:hypothetical protein